jgi:hypothetical protein
MRSNKWLVDAIAENGHGKDEIQGAVVPWAVDLYQAAIRRANGRLRNWIVNFFVGNFFRYPYVFGRFILPADVWLNQFDVDAIKYYGSVTELVESSRWARMNDLGKVIAIRRLNTSSPDFSRRAWYGSHRGYDSFQYLHMRLIGHMMINLKFVRGDQVTFVEALMLWVRTEVRLKGYLWLDMFIATVLEAYANNSVIRLVAMFTCVDQLGNPAYLTLIDWILSSLGTNDIYYIAEARRLSGAIRRTTPQQVLVHYAQISGAINLPGRWPIDV